MPLQKVALAGKGTHVMLDVAWAGATQRRARATQAMAKVVLVMSGHMASRFRADQNDEAVKMPRLCDSFIGSVKYERIATYNRDR